MTPRSHTLLLRLFIRCFSVIALLLLTAAGPASLRAQVKVRTKISQYVPPRPAFANFHVGMSQDSAFLVMRKIAMRSDTLHVDSLTLLESDSIRIFGQPAYIQLQIANKRVKTIVINYHPMGGGSYLQLREFLDEYLERAMGRGVVLHNESIEYHRWETEDGTTEVSHSDKYLRVFVRLGKPRV